MGEVSRVVSHAQNAEDIVLLRAFRDRSDGYYIDVGAGHPTNESVTKVFYDRGWIGVNVEPCVEMFRELERERIRDVNLNVGLADFSGEAIFFEVVERKGSSTFVREIADEIRKGGLAIEERVVEISTLTNVCEKHVPGEIQFLKVDVEGFEAPVLKGLDWDRWRPWVIVVEATRPWTAVPSHSDWEPILLGHDYGFALFDGLNRFYVRRDLEEIESRVSVPANVLDNYISVVHARVREGYEREVQYAVQLREDIDRKKMELQRASEHIEKLTRENGLMKIEIDRASEYIERINQELELRNRRLDRLRSKVEDLEMPLSGWEESADGDGGKTGD